MNFRPTATAFVSTLFALAGLSSPTLAAEIANGGFEASLDGWVVDDAADADVAISGETNSGEKSLKITGEKGLAQQTVFLEPNSHYELSGYYKGAALVGIRVGNRIYFDRKPKSKSWKKVKVTFNSDEATKAVIFLGHNRHEGRYDDFALSYKGVQGDQEVSTNVIAKSSGGTGLSPDLAPGGNFDLLGWNISVPTDKDKNGKSDTINELDLAKGYQDERFFYTAPDGGMVFRCPVKGYKTSKNTSYTRTELREMLRRGDKSIRTKTDDGKPNNCLLYTSPSPRDS